jgi:hypothetical protein
MPPVALPARSSWVDMDCAYFTSDTLCSMKEGMHDSCSQFVPPS